MPQLTAAAVIDHLGLAPHPEGGWFRETWRAPAAPGERSTGTAILFLLAAGERSHWHRVDATEIWHHHAGAPLALAISTGDDHRRLVLGDDLMADQVPQAIVAPDAWQAARSLGPWTLVGCTVSPGFDFAGFELAPPGWAPAGATEP